MTGMIVVESLNIGLPKKEIFYGKEIVTGICKVPIKVIIVGLKGEALSEEWA